MEEAKSGYDGCMANLLRFISLFRDFLRHSFSPSATACYFLVCPVNKTAKERNVGYETN